MQVDGEGVLIFPCVSGGDHLHLHAGLNVNQKDHRQRHLPPRHMHHCLRIAEILTMIMNFLVGDAERGNREVLSLLKTCKALYDPALDILWRDLDILAPLVMCLPGDVWKIKNKLVVRITIVLNCSTSQHLIHILSPVPDENAESKRIIQIHVSCPAREKHWS
jgi:hypothetical protein